MKNEGVPNRLDTPSRTLSEVLLCAVAAKHDEQNKPSRVEVSTVCLKRITVVLSESRMRKDQENPIDRD